MKIISSFDPHSTSWEAFHFFTSYAHPDLSCSVTPVTLSNVAPQNLNEWTKWHDPPELELLSFVWIKTDLLAHPVRSERYGKTKIQNFPVLSLGFCLQQDRPKPEWRNETGLEEGVRFISVDTQSSSWRGSCGSNSPCYVLSLKGFHFTEQQAVLSAAITKLYWQPWIS